MTDNEDKLIAELDSLADTQERIDLVAEDLMSGKNKFAPIDAWKLGELLGLDLNDTGDWGRSFYAYRQDIADSGCDHPYAEHIELLKGKIPAERYEELNRKANDILGADDSKKLPDLRPRKKERQLLEDAYAEENAGTCGLDVASTSLNSTSGDSLEFQVSIGDGGVVDEAKSPYDIEKGDDIDLSDYVWIE